MMFYPTTIECFICGVRGDTDHYAKFDLMIGLRGSDSHDRPLFDNNGNPRRVCLCHGCESEISNPEIVLYLKGHNLPAYEVEEKS